MSKLLLDSVCPRRRRADPVALGELAREHERFVHLEQVQPEEGLAGHSGSGIHDSGFNLSVGVCTHHTLQKPENGGGKALQ